LLQRRIGHVLKRPGVQIRGVTTFLKPDVSLAYNDGWQANASLVC
jgi:hypothetical protein